MGSKKKLQAMIFDIGGVFTLDQDSGVLARLSKLTGIEIPLFKNRYRMFRDNYDAGLWSAQQFWDAMWPERNVHVDQLISLDFASWSSLRAETIEWAENLRKNHVLTGILSNMPKEGKEHFLKLCPAIASAAVRVFSCDHGVCKPEKQLYMTILKELQVPASQCLFIDDNQVNVTSAKEIGMESFLVADNIAELRERVETDYFFESGARA